MIRFYIANVLHLFFYCYTMLILGRIVISWIPSWQNTTIVRFISFCTDPYLNVFRRIIPPLGGVLDLSPLLAFFTLRLAESFLLKIII